MVIGCAEVVDTTPTTTTTLPQLPAPSGLSPSAGSLQVALTWNGTTAASAYNLYWSNNSPVTTADKKITGITAASYVHTGLTNEAAYFYAVAAVNAASVEGALSPTVVASPDTIGQLDNSFNSSGVVAYASSFSAAMKAVIDSNGRIITCGLVYSGIGYLAVWRYNPDGTLDTSFGTGGVYTDSVQGMGFDLALDSGGNILVSGQRGTPTMEAAVWRLTPAGVLDTTFGSGGVATHVLGSLNAGLALCLDSAGKVFVAGYATGAGEDIAIWRFSAAGAYENMITHDDSGGDDEAREIAFDPTGRLFVSGFNNISGTEYMFTACLDPNTLAVNPTFGSAGSIKHLGGGLTSRGYGLAFDPAGRVIICGRSDDSSKTRMTVWRYDSAGTLDTTFGSGAGFINQSGVAGGTYDVATGCLLDGHGRLVVGGFSQNASADNDAAFWRLTAGGALDNSFNGTGYFTHNNAAGGNGNETLMGVILDSYHRIVGSGDSVASGGTAHNMVLWRLK